jgi:hypothetical protein
VVAEVCGTGRGVALLHTHGPPPLPLALLQTYVAERDRCVFGTALLRPGCLNEAAGGRTWVLGHQVP